MSARAAVFDVDGTLADTNHLHTVCWWEALRQAGHRVPMVSVLGAIGLGSSDLLEHLLGQDRDRDEDASLSAAHKTLYATWFERIAPVEGAAELLRRLHADGWPVVLATSAGGSELAALRAAIDADDAITETASADDVKEGKPSAEPVRHALELVGAQPQGSVFVGDSVWDMQAARRAGVVPLGVLSGGVSRAELEKAGAAEVYADTAELLRELDGSAFGRN
ncbi:HAD family hydrolase [Streptomyces kunmingensis]|uniref:HAD family hydrolase n=1 Tax=Streptomyces kunmingensis TaxID=68225 RepID=A0ABU6CGT1_9ACTN|nr:HAD family hydrolase [Streptomyces kunmingensis]MEB3963922.1 HAD family hydrolase [Streptomyces kunmingensis]